MSKDYLDKWEKRAKENTKIIALQQTKTKKMRHEKKMKYVCFYDNRREENVIIIFYIGLAHSTFSSLNPHSGGFIDIRDGKAICFGKSMTLGVESNTEIDAHLANKQIFRTIFRELNQNKEDEM